MSERQIINRAKKLKALEEQKATLEKEIAAVKAEIQSEMQDVEQLQAGNFIIRWTTTATQRLDTAALKKAYAELYRQFTKRTESRRFSIIEA